MALMLLMRVVVSALLDKADNDNDKTNSEKTNKEKIN